MAFMRADPAWTIVEASSIEEARKIAPAADMMTLDLGLPDCRGTQGLAALREEFPTLPMLVISGAAHPGVERQVAAIGAKGFLPKSATMGDMIAAIGSVIDNGTWFTGRFEEGADEDDAFARLASLTPAQRRVLDAMESGRLNKQIAYDLGLSEITVKVHVKAILKKLDVINRTQAILLLREVEA